MSRGTPSENSFTHNKSRSLQPIYWLASVAQLDAHLTGDQEVAGSTPA